MSTPIASLVASLVKLFPAVFATMGVPLSVHLPEHHPIVVRATSCAEDVAATVELLPEPTQRAAWAPVLLVFALKEGNCYANPPGYNDDGRACGVLQTHSPEMEIPGATCAKVRADRRLGLRVGLARMLRLTKTCGSIGAGLTAYAMTGECPKGWVLPLVAERLKLAGVAPSLTL